MPAGAIQIDRGTARIYFLHDGEEPGAGSFWGGRHSGGGAFEKGEPLDERAGPGIQGSEIGLDAGVAQAKEAEALAKASIFQATSEKERWKDLEIR